MRVKSKIKVVVVGALVTCVMGQGFSVEQAKEVMIKFKADASAELVDSLTNSLGLVKVKSIEEINVNVFRVPEERSVAEVVRLCSNAAFVEYAEPNQAARALAIEEAPETPGPAPAAMQAETAEFVAGEIIIKFKSDVSQATMSSTLADAGIRITKRYGDISVVRCEITGDKSVLKAVEECNASDIIEYAEPNYIYRASVEPNDSRFSSLYGMRQIDAPEAWDVQKGNSSVIIGVIDTGVDTEHEDLAANMWTNPGESGGGKEDNDVDDDGNGFVDDYRGWDFINGDNNPFDDNDHGTHCSGIAGAVGNNGKGVVGVNWSVSIMPLKFLGANGSGTTDDAVDAIIYGTKMGAKVLSNSWGGGGRSQALEDAIQYANDNGVLFVAAAGNEGSNNDRTPSYPANYEVPNVISVASNTSSDRLSGFSNYGVRTVDLAAPGSEILSTVARDRYDSFSGTSMATPHVSGAAALVWAQYPDLTVNRVIIRLLGSVDKSINYADRTLTGGRLNVSKALSTNPIIARTTRLDNTLDEVGPYVVEADILDDSDSTIQSAVLTYQVSEQEAVEVNMTTSGNDHYMAEIPGQTLGSTIVYFVSATDDEGNLTRDSNHTFSIAEPTNGGGCCGKPPIEFTGSQSPLSGAVTAALNIGLFLLPIVALRLRDRKRRD